MKITTTLKLLKKNDACENGLQTLLDHIGHGYSENDPINLLTILESNGIDHCFWSFKAAEQDWEKVRKILISIVCDIAESVLPIFERKYTDDKRPRQAIEAARAFNNGDKSVNVNLIADAANDAASAADAAFADNADYSAGYAASFAASFAAYSCATAAVAATSHENDVVNSCSAAGYAADAASTSIRKKQAEIIKKYLTMED